MSDPSGGATCAFHAPAADAATCAGCRRSLCPRCAVPREATCWCVDCWSVRFAPAPNGAIEPLPLVAGSLAVATGAGSLAAGAYLAPTLLLASLALGWGLGRHLALPAGRPARSAILAWTLGAVGLALCAVKIHLFGAGLSGALVP